MISAEKRWGMGTKELEKRILSLHKGGKGILKIGRELGVGTSFVQRVIKKKAIEKMIATGWLTKQQIADWRERGIEPRWRGRDDI